MIIIRWSNSSVTLLVYAVNLIALSFFLRSTESFIMNRYSNFDYFNTLDNILHRDRDLSKLQYTDNNENSVESSVNRFEVSGVSVSPIGFLVLLSVSDFSESSQDSSTTNMKSVGLKRRTKEYQVSNNKRTTLCIRISNDKADEVHCSSPEALTIVQLLSGVDMAGAVLPPQLLQHIVALHCSVLDRNSDAYRVMRSAVAKVLHKTSYLEATPWQRGQIRYPKVSLKAVNLSLPLSLDQETESFLSSLRQWNVNSDEKNNIAASPLPMKFQLECSVDGFPISIPLFSEQLADSNTHFLNTEYLHKATYSYTPSSAAFISLSLALRYHTPISISTSTLSLLRSHNSPCTIFGTSSQLNQCLPQWKSVSSFINQSNGVMQNVQKCFEANQLQGALRIALIKGDEVAAQKIQERLKQFDNFDDLPVVKGMDGVDKGGVLEKEEDDSWA